MKHKKLLVLIVAVLLVWAIAESKYEELPCETRFRLEVQYIEMYSDGAYPLKNATFTLEELKGEMEDVCSE